MHGHQQVNKAEDFFVHRITETSPVNVSVFALLSFDTVIGFFMLPAPDASQQLTSVYGLPVPAALKVTRVICAAGRNMAASLVRHMTWVT